MGRRSTVWYLRHHDVQLPGLQQLPSQEELLLETGTEWLARLWEGTQEWRGLQRLFMTFESL